MQNGDRARDGRQFWIDRGRHIYGHRRGDARSQPFGAQTALARPAPSILTPQPEGHPPLLMRLGARCANPVADQVRAVKIGTTVATFNALLERFSELTVLRDDSRPRRSA